MERRFTAAGCAFFNHQHFHIGRAAPTRIHVTLLRLLTHLEVSMAEFPPNLITYITNGFNVKTGDFVSAPIFQVPADSGQAVTFGLAQKTYAVPEGFMVDGVASFKTVSKNTL